jgi:tRNA A-37 threonylcarbamoyl transferase component Bud32
MIAAWVAKYALAAAVAFAAMAGWSAWMQSNGVNKERARVETIGKKIDAKARTARTKAEAKPDDALRRWCRDC